MDNCVSNLRYEGLIFPEMDQFIFELLDIITFVLLRRVSKTFKNLVDSSETGKEILSLRSRLSKYKFSKLKYIDRHFIIEKLWEYGYINIIKNLHQYKQSLSVLIEYKTDFDQYPQKDQHLYLNSYDVAIIATNGNLDCFKWVENNFILEIDSEIFLKECMNFMPFDLKGVLEWLIKRDPELMVSEWQISAILRYQMIDVLEFLLTKNLLRIDFYITNMYCDSIIVSAKVLEWFLSKKIPYDAQKLLLSWIQGHSTYYYSESRNDLIRAHSLRTIGEFKKIVKILKERNQIQDEDLNQMCGRAIKEYIDDEDYQISLRWFRQCGFKFQISLEMLEPYEQWMVNTIIWVIRNSYITIDDLPSYPQTKLQQFIHELISKNKD